MQPPRDFTPSTFDSPTLYTYLPAPLLDVSIVLQTACDHKQYSNLICLSVRPSVRDKLLLCKTE